MGYSAQLRVRILLGGMAAGILMVSCATTLPKPHQLVAPTPINGNYGKYMCPYTSDGVVAEWVDKGINAKIGATAGKIGGAYLGAKAMEQVPFVGGILGSYVGGAIGRQVAISSCGGWDYIKSTSDLSFNTIDDMAVYLYVNYSSNVHYQKVFEATCEIYPYMKNNYGNAIRKAPQKY